MEGSIRLGRCADSQPQRRDSAEGEATVATIVTLDDAQAALLRELLDRALRELRYERADTDNPEYKRMLRDREATLRAVLEPLGGPLPDAPLGERQI